MFHSPGDIAFSAGEFEIYWYGIIMSVSMLMGIVVISVMAKKYFKEITFDLICDLSFVLITAGLIFARLYYIILDYGYYSRFPAEIIAIWNGGLSIQGGIIGGILAGWIYAAEEKLNFFKLADLFTFGIITGQIIGRWGNFFNSEAFGLPTDLPWKLYIPIYSRPLEFRQFEYFHPTFLYESLLNIIVFIILFIMLKKMKNRKDGLIFFSYIILYSIVRIFVEALRLDSVLYIGGLHVAHYACIIYILLGIAGILYINKKNTGLN